MKIQCPKPPYKGNLRKFVPSSLQIITMWSERPCLCETLVRTEPGAEHLACILQLIIHTWGPRLKTLGLNLGSILKASSSEHLHWGEHKGKGTKTMHWKDSGREVSLPFLSYYESSSVLIPTAGTLCCTSQTQGHAKSVGALKGRASLHALAQAELPHWYHVESAGKQQHRPEPMLSLDKETSMARWAWSQAPHYICWNSGPFIYKAGS